jgi:tetratricopeptide (TPR) repeat protein
VLAGALPALAQVDLVDPDAKPANKVAPGAQKPRSKAAPAADDDDERPRQPIDLKPGETPEIAPEEPEEAPKPQPKQEPKRALAPKKADAKREPAPKAPPPPIVITRLSDADLDSAWERWRVANTAFQSDAKAEANARAELLRLKAEIGALDVEGWSVALLRAAARHEEEGSSAVAIEQALGALELAPNLPSSHFGLARAYFAADPSDIGRYLSALQGGVGRLVTEPRYARPLIADLSTALLAAFAITAVFVIAVLFARRGRYFLFDFNFFFPRAVPRWQSSAIALVLLTLPVVFRLGVVPCLLCIFAALTLYLSPAERWVAGLMIALLGVVPVLGSLLVRHTAFADTAAEDAWQLLRGGPGAEPVAQRVARRAAEDKATFGELFALGTFELHRGKLDLAIARLKAALQKTPDEPRAQVNLGVAMFLGGDLENPQALFEAAAKTAPELAAPWFDLSRLCQRRVQVLGLEQASADVDKGNAAMLEAQQRDALLAQRADAEGKLSGNTHLLTVSIARRELLALTESSETEGRVYSQLSLMLLGNVNAPWAPLYPLGAALLLLGVGALNRRIGAARACAKCGQPMSRREDPELSEVSVMCTQCVNVFAKKGVVPAALKVRKQVEVARYQSRVDRLTFGLGLLCSGMGHVFRGLPVRGALYAFFFVFAAVAVALRDGVLRAPFEGLPIWVRVVPTALLLLTVYGLSVRGLFKKGQGAT